MYQQFYRLDDIPFSLAPDPKYLFRTESLLEVLANLRYGIGTGKGLIVVTGEVGTGKTTILRSMLQTLDRRMLAAYVFNPILSTEEFFALLAGELRLPPQPNKAGMLRALGHLLVTRSAQGMRTVLIVDEAHLCPPHLLEEIRLLSNFETNREKLLQIVLCGQPELHTLLLRPELRQLKQRVSLKCSVRPLTRPETGQYIRWRLKLAGATNVTIFQNDAIESIYRFSSGIPRIINNICDNALLSGFSEGFPVITAGVISEVAELLDLSPAETTLAQSPGNSNGHTASISRSLVEVRPDNVRYMRPNIGPAKVEENCSNASQDESEFVIETEDSVPDSKFFTKVRVTRKPTGLT